MRNTWVAGCALVLLAVGAVHGAEIAGVPRIVDGDTLVIGSERIRLEGIDAPETDQVCLGASGVRWTCGIDARDKLNEHIAGREVSCVSSGTDRYHRTLAICYAAGEDLNSWMVQAGLALAYVQYSKRYAAHETSARDQQRGIWAGAFIAPWDWRHRDKQTVILGALSVPASAQAQLLAPASSEGAPSPECTIKGNVNRDGERIYHMPGQRNYAQVNMHDSAKRWFCSEAEAQAAGWRRAAR